MTGPSNSEFLRVALGELDDGTFGWVTQFSGDPNAVAPEVWTGRAYRGTSAQAGIVDRDAAQNAYFSTAVLRQAADGTMARRGEAFDRVAVLLADDVDTSMLMGRATYVIETSQGKYQAGVVIDPADPDARNRPLVNALMSELGQRAGNDQAGNACVRYGRLPRGRNGKPAAGGWQVRVIEWNPEHILSLADAAAVLGIDLDALRDRAEHPPRQVAASASQSDRVAELTHNITMGVQLHDSLRDLAASMVASGAHGGTVVNLLRGLMDASAAPRDERWQSRYDEIRRLVESAEKFKPAGTAPGGAASASDQTQAPTVLSLINAAELAPASAQEVFDDELIEGVLGKSVVACIYGDSNSGKTFMAIDMCAAIAQGTRWMGRHTEPGIVLYLATESPASVKMRLRAYKSHHQVNLERFFIVPNPVSLFNDEADIQAVLAVVEEVQNKYGQRVAVIVGDTLARLSAGANENSGQDMGVVLKNCDRIREASGATFVLIHHTGKVQAKGMRGWSGMRAHIDTEIEVTSDEETGLRCAEITKQRDLDSRGQRHGFRLHGVTIGQNKWGKQRTSAVVIPDQAPDRKGKARSLGRVETAVLDNLIKARSGVKRKDLVQQMAPEVQSTNVYRAIRNLVQVGLVHEAAGLVCAASMARAASSDHGVITQ